MPSFSAELVSASYVPGDGADGDSFTPSISEDGRYIAYRSAATNLVDDDPNGVSLDIFVFDTVMQSAELVTVGNDGSSGADGDSFLPAISANGRYVAFASIATNLGSDDPNGAVNDVFLRDLVGNTTTRVSVAQDGAGGGDGSSSWAAISGDGRYIAFRSEASNLVANDPNGNTPDVFVRDVVNGTTTLVTVSHDIVSGANGVSDKTSISSDGRFVAFESTASNLVENDPNGIVRDVFVRDLLNETTVRVSVALDDTNGANGASYDPSLSPDGQFIAFRSHASNLTSVDANGSTGDIFVRDMVAGTTILASVTATGTANANSDSYGPSISTGGRYLVFQSAASNLVDVDPNGAVSDIFLRDLVVGENTLMSTPHDGFGGANGASLWPKISSDGKKVAFSSSASNIVFGDENENISDIFLSTRSSLLFRDGFESP